MQSARNLIFRPIDPEIYALLLDHSNGDLKAIKLKSEHTSVAKQYANWWLYSIYQNHSNLVLIVIIFNASIIVVAVGIVEIFISVGNRRKAPFVSIKITTSGAGSCNSFNLCCEINKMAFSNSAAIGK